MADHEARARALYDFEIEDAPRASGRRRRPVADWGVGEDAFDRMPSRRFSRAEGAHGRRSEPQRDGRDELRTATRRGEGRFERRDVAREDRAGTATGAVAADPEARTAEFAVPQAAPVASRAPETAGSPAPAASSAPGPSREGAPERRTVQISGRPDRMPAPRANRRPPRSAVERVGARPDRIVAYAVALGFLLILIAILTAGH